MRRSSLSLDSNNSKGENRPTSHTTKANRPGTSRGKQVDSMQSDAVRLRSHKKTGEPRSSKTGKISNARQAARSKSSSAKIRADAAIVSKPSNTVKKTTAASTARSKSSDSKMQKKLTQGKSASLNKATTIAKKNTASRANTTKSCKAKTKGKSASQTLKKQATKKPVSTRSAPTSKLSQGPKNQAHKTFLRNTKNINAALCKGISCRRMDMKAKEIYVNAGITAPTFYLRYRSAGKALTSFEKSLLCELRDIAPTDIKRDAFYVLLTSYVAKNRQYFRASAKGGSHYLLHKIVTSYRANLVGDKISERAFRQYIGSIIVTIECWLEFERITPETTKACAKELMRIRPIRW